MRRLLIWTGLDEWRVEAATVDLTENGVVATGVQLGLDPTPYRLDYELDAAHWFMTRRLRVEARGAAWSRALTLERDEGGAWHAEQHAEGTVDLSSQESDLDGLDDALDCDLGLSPLTNLMPIRRHRLHEGPGEAELPMAFVTAPALAVAPSLQRYEHIRSGPDGAVVRYRDLGLFEGFTSDLELDADGLVRVYPGLARRLEAEAGGA
jgi:hypothetical protein